MGDANVAAEEELLLPLPLWSFSSAAARACAGVFWLLNGCDADDGSDDETSLSIKPMAYRRRLSQSDVDVV